MRGIDEMVAGLALYISDGEHEMITASEAVRFFADDPVMQRCEIMLRAAQRAAIKRAAQMLEGKIGAEIQRQEAERWVGVLCDVLYLVRPPKVPGVFTRIVDRIMLSADPRCSIFTDADLAHGDGLYVIRLNADGSAVCEPEREPRAEWP